MIARFFLFLIACLCIMKAPVFSGEPIEWLTNYDHAVQRSQNSEKTLCIFISGNANCQWSKKLESRIFRSRDFIKKVKDEFVFLKVPLFSRSTPRAYKKKLKKMYDINSVPAVLLVDSDGNLIAMTGYFSGRSRNYADFLLDSVREYSDLKRDVFSMENRSLSSQDLQKLYHRAREMHVTTFAEKILVKGMDTENNTFFLLETYRQRVEAGKMNDPKTIAIRTSLTNAKVDNICDVHYRIAVVDFQALSSSSFSSSKAAVKPLVKYLDAFGGENKNNDWKIKMTIAQYLHSHNYTKEALKYAQSGYENAPNIMKDDIAMVIDSMQTTR